MKISKGRYLKLRFYTRQCCLKERKSEKTMPIELKFVIGEIVYVLKFQLV